MKTKIAILSLANDAAEAVGALLGLANDFQPADDGWIQIAPYGDYPHQGRISKTGKRLDPEGCLQRMDAKAGEAMANEFNSLLSQAKRIFGGRPWYRGHHDIDPIKYPDPNAYGWIMKLANRDDGVYGLIDWTPEGKKLIEDKSFKYFSPYWDVADTKAKSTDGRKIVMPLRLNSVGFTNKPNIPVMPLANETELEEPTFARKEQAADFIIENAIAEGVLLVGDRDEWLGYFNEDFKTAQFALANADRSEAARKGWVTRRANMGAAAAKAPKAAAKAAGKTMKKSRSTKPKKPKAPKPAKEETAPKAKREPKKATPPPLPKKVMPPPLPPLKPAAVRPQQLTTRFPGGEAVPFVSAAAHQIKTGHNPFF